jgi:hypothetical protein
VPSAAYPGVLAVRKKACVTREAVCLRCGAWKRTVTQSCSSCGFAPKEDQDLLKSVYLSVLRYDDEEDRNTYKTTLDELASKLRADGEIEFDEDELARLRQRLKGFQSVSSRQVWGAVFRFFLPGLFFLGGLLLLLYFVRATG